MSFVEEEIQQAEAASFAMAASITQIGHDGQIHHVHPSHHVIQGQHLNTQLQQHLLQQVSNVFKFRFEITAVLQNTYYLHVAKTVHFWGTAFGHLTRETNISLNDFVYHEKFIENLGKF